VFVVREVSHAEAFGSATPAQIPNPARRREVCPLQKLLRLFVAKYNGIRQILRSFRPKPLKVLNDLVEVLAGVILPAKVSRAENLDVVDGPLRRAQRVRNVVSVIYKGMDSLRHKGTLSLSGKQII
jgi:hypothetical protein